MGDGQVKEDGLRCRGGPTFLGSPSPAPARGVDLVRIERTLVREQPRLISR